MRSFGSFFAALLFSFCAFTTTYSGAGTWKSSEGDSGNYTVVANVELGDDDTIVISQTLNFEEETLDINFILQKIDDTFYNIINSENGAVIGAGYCWPLDSEEEQICHSVSHLDDYVVESTVKKTADALYRIGSKTNIATGKKVIWKDTLEKQDNQ